MSRAFLLALSGLLVPAGLPLFAQVDQVPAATPPVPAVEPASPVAVTNTTVTPVVAPLETPVITPVADGAHPVHASAIILGYHQFTAGNQHSGNIYSMTAEAFESEMKYLKDNGCNVVPLTDIVHFVEGKGTLPPHAVAITIDDGYKSPILYAEPILKKYGYPWTFFVYPDFIADHESKGAASWDDLKALQAEGVDIESHSKSHPQLTKTHGKTPEAYDVWLTAETAGAKATIEQHLGTSVKYLAYPFGDYNKVVQDKAIASGYEAIFTVAGNPVHETTPAYCMGRYVITSPEEKDFAAYLRQGALSIMEATPSPGATETNPRPVISAVLNYPGKLDPKSIEASVKEIPGKIPADYDDKTSTVRLYLQRDLVNPAVDVIIRIKDAEGKTLATSWRFNYTASATPTAPAIGTLIVPVPVVAPQIVPVPANPARSKT